MSGKIVNNRNLNGACCKLAPNGGKRNIVIVAPFLADNFVDLEEPIFDTDEYAKYLNESSDKLGLFRKYLICKLHDSCVVESTQDFDNFKIKLNDFSTHVFADAIVERKKNEIPHRKLVFPLTIELKGELEFTYNTVDDNGFLNEIDIVEINEYLYEQVTKLENNRIEIVFVFWAKRLREKIVIIASCKKLVITENQDQTWNKIFGNKYDDYYQYFKEQFDSERYVSDIEHCLKLVDEYEQKTNRTVNQK